MDYNSGEFACKKCKNNGMNIYTNWLNRKKYINNSIERQWIFYNKTIIKKKQLKCNVYSNKCFSKPFFLCDEDKCWPFGFCNGEVALNFFLWPVFVISLIVVCILNLIVIIVQAFILLLVCVFNRCNWSCRWENTICFVENYIKLWKKCLECNNKIIEGILLFLLSIILLPIILLYIILSGLLYILVFMWIDICIYCCCKKNEYKYVYSYFQNNNIYQGSLIANDKKDIWKYCEGIAEKELIEQAKYLFTCPKCNWHYDTFKDFIPGISFNDNNYNNDNNDTVDNLNVYPDNEISIIFISSAQNFHYAVICKLDDTFESIENKLYQENPNLRTKNLFFLSKGTAIIDKKKTLSQLRFKNSDIITFYENE